MANPLDDVVEMQDLKKFEAQYHQQLETGRVEEQTQWEYAFCLVRSPYAADIRKGCILLEDLYSRGDGPTRRDYIYYLAVGNAKLKEYKDALKYVQALLAAEPSNPQAKELEALIRKNMEKEGLKGMAVAGGAILGLGALIGLGIALARK
ncbi:unnamed protein product [Darwinula stevensoni]|uniref:Mitochondrial fission 1 protein n=1 Tax=Darwinula stevensoni TaxID=69355 RepID=A0A7R8XC42_9CRUS|nr:unnamed protein product [Darwinula stevensoni]CAG0885490.1 unnamed protein product [Darwinula stevensoni]